MDVSNEGRRRRKGISVSLTPDKKVPIVNQTNQIQIHPVQPSPRNQQIFLQQSYARVGMQPIIPKFVRVIPVTRPLDCPNVRFTYSSVSKQQEIKEGLALDQELHILKKQLQSKRHTVETLNKQRGEMSISNVRPYSVQQTKKFLVNDFQQSNVTVQPITIIQQEFRPIKSPVHHLSPIRVNAFCSDPATTELKPKIQNKEISASPSKIRQQSIIRQQKKVNPQKTLVQAYSNKVEIMPINKQIKKEPNQIPTKNLNKENNKNLSQRIEKLKWAQQKLLDIIKVCDNGL